MRSSYSIIIADDDETTCSLMASIVKRIYPSAQVFIAHNGVEAIHLYGQHGGDLFIIDYTMPLMNGLDLMRMLRSRQITTPIVMISGHSLIEQMCLAAGANLFYLKPIDLNQFMSDLILLLSP